MEEDFLNNELIDSFEQMLENENYKYYDSEELVEIIGFYIEVNDHEYAKRALEFAEKIHPNNLDVKIKRIEYLLFIEDLKGAGNLIIEIKDIASSEADYLLVQARYWGLKNMPRKAISFYEKVLEIDDEETDFICNCIGNEYLNLNDTKFALSAFKRSLKFNPENSYSFYSIIQCYEEIHDEVNCINFLKDYIENRPYSEAAWLQLGLLFKNKKQYKKAIDAFEYVIAINPSSIISYTNKAYALEKLGLLSEAIETLEDSLEYDDSPASTYLKIGEIFEKLKKTQKALKAYHFSIKEDPQLDKAWAKAASLYDKLSNYEEAEYYINRALELDEHNANYYSNSIYYYLKQMKFEEAIKNLEKLIELKPLVFSSWYTYVETLIAVGEYNQAIKVLIDGALKNFNRAEFFYQLSYLYYITNQDELGEVALKDALSLNKKIKNTMLNNYPILQEKVLIISK